MKLEEALNYADEWTNGHTFYEGMQGWRVVCAVLAAEVRRLRAPAVEDVPLGYALAIRNHGDGELMVYRNPFSRSDKTDCIPLYMHPPSLDGDTRNQSEGKLEMVYIAEIIEQVRAIKTPKPACIDQYIKNE